MAFPKDELESLWAPWRYEYFERRDNDPDFLLHAAQSADDAAHLVLLRREHSLLMMNRYPYTAGHLMAVPGRKVARLESLRSEEKLELLDLVEVGQDLLTRVIKAQGFNIGINVGHCAGAGVPGHLHVHIVPRWEGDNNFMPVLAGRRVLAESLEQLYDKLKSSLLPAA